MTPLQQRLVIGACLMVFAAWLPALAQRAQGRQGGSMYDATHEAGFAREIRKGANTWTLRDQFGRPLWCGGRR